MSLNFNLNLDILHIFLLFSYELFKFYDVDAIIRVGSCGAYTKDLELYDVIVASHSYSYSTYAKMQNGFKKKEISSSPDLNSAILDYANKNNIKVNVGKIHSSDVFYSDVIDYQKLYTKHGILAVEMESYALFHNANALGKKAACILTVSDNLETKKETTSAERQTAFTVMMEVALGSLID